jgi:hypothetical protein
MRLYRTPPDFFIRLSVMTCIFISTSSNEEAHLMACAAKREGYHAEARNRYVYFPESIWRINLAKLIERERLSVSWSGAQCTVGRDGLHVTGRSMQEAVLRYLAERPVEAAA